MLIVTIANECVNYYNSTYYVTPQEKYMLIRVMIFCLYLIDGAKKISDKDKSTIWSGGKVDVRSLKDKGFDAFKKGGLNVDGIRTIVTSNPNIPLMFEITFSPVKYLKMV